MHAEATITNRNQCMRGKGGRSRFEFNGTEYENFNDKLLIHYRIDLTNMPINQIYVCLEFTVRFENNFTAFRPNSVGISLTTWKFNQNRLAAKLFRNIQIKWIIERNASPSQHYNKKKKQQLQSMLATERALHAVLCTIAMRMGWKSCNVRHGSLRACILTAQCRCCLCFFSIWMIFRYEINQFSRIPKHKSGARRFSAIKVSVPFHKSLL